MIEREAARMAAQQGGDEEGGGLLAPPPSELSWAMVCFLLIALGATPDHSLLAQRLCKCPSDIPHPEGCKCRNCKSCTGRWTCTSRKCR